MVGRDPAPPAEPSTEASAIGSRSVAWLLVLMTIVLVILVVVLLWMLGRGSDPEFSYVQSGLESVLALTGPGKGDRPEFSRPLSAGWGPRNEIYVSDTGNARVCVFSEGGRFVRQFGRAREGMSEDERSETLLQPAGIAVSQDGTVYVADLRRDAVLVFDEEGSFLEMITSTPGWRPVDVAVRGERLAVAGAAGITVMSLDGEIETTLDASETGTKLNRPNGVAFLSATGLAVADTNNARIVGMGINGDVSWVSTGDVSGRATGLPRGLSVGSDGSVLYADAFRFAIARVSDAGEPRGLYGARGVQPAAFEFPNDVDMLQDLALVADKDNNRIQVVRLLGWPEADGVMEPVQ